MPDEISLKYPHLGMPTGDPIEGEEYMKEYKVYHYGYGGNPYGIEWMRYEDGCSLPRL